MTMHKIHISHWHGPDWHTLKMRLRELVHDPRFWAGVLVAGVLLLALIVGFLIEPGQTGRLEPFGYPLYPYLP